MLRRLAVPILTVLALLALVTLGLKTLLEWKQERDFEQAQRAPADVSGEFVPRDIRKPQRLA